MTQSNLNQDQKAHMDGEDSIFLRELIQDYGWFRTCADERRRTWSIALVVHRPSGSPEAAKGVEVSGRRQVEVAEQRRGVAESAGDELADDIELTMPISSMRHSRDFLVFQGLWNILTCSAQIDLNSHAVRFANTRKKLSTARSRMRVGKVTHGSL